MLGGGKVSIDLAARTARLEPALTTFDDPRSFYFTALLPAGAPVLRTTMTVPPAATHLNAARIRLRYGRYNNPARTRNAVEAATTRPRRIVD